MIRIKEPYWKYNAVGLADDKLEDVTEVQILYEDRFGNRKYPHTYLISKEKARKFHSEYKRGHKLYIVPIDQMFVKEEI